MLICIAALKDRSGGSSPEIKTKSTTAHKFLNEQFSHHTVRKTHLALAHGVLTQEHGTIDAPLRQFGSGRMGVDSIRGKGSVTTFQMLTRFNSYTLVEVQPVTGRRHQIRVHLYSLGQAIVGDPLENERGNVNSRA
jgi:tRNA pseudouridine32 synthase/23S rRNA pseudouridine746 synthase